MPETRTLDCGHTTTCWCGHCHTCDPMPEDDEPTDSEDGE